MTKLKNKIILLADGSSGNINLMIGYINSSNNKNYIHSRISLKDKGQDSRIFSSLNNIFHRLELDKSYFRNNLSYISIVNGPGSFTGLRIICSMINGILSVNKAKLISVNYFNVVQNSIPQSNMLILPSSCRKDYYWKLIIENNSSKSVVMQGNNDALYLWKSYLYSLTTKPLTIIGDDAKRLMAEFPVQPSCWKVINIDILQLLWQYSETKMLIKQYPFARWAVPFYGKEADITLKSKPAIDLI